MSKNKPEPKKRPSERIDEIFRDLMDQRNFKIGMSGVLEMKIKAIKTYLDEAGQ